MPIILLFFLKKKKLLRNFEIIMNDDKYEKCGEIYSSIYYKWCEPCQINNFKKEFSYGTSENEKINKFIQGMQLKINKWNDVIVEWIPYNQFNDIKEISKG